MVYLKFLYLILNPVGPIYLFLFLWTFKLLKKENNPLIDEITIEDIEKIESDKKEKDEENDSNMMMIIIMIILKKLKKSKMRKLLKKWINKIKLRIALIL